jgi:VWFA-related protein
MDVSVLDKKGRPVTGLTATDFTVLDEGQPRKIVAFSAVALPDVESPTATWMQSASRDVASNQFAARRLIVVVFARKTPAAERVGRALLANVGTADMASVMDLERPDLRQGFTTDRALLDQAVDLMMDPPLPVTPPILLFFRLDPLTQLIDSLQGVSGVRKVVFLIGRDGVGGPLSERDRLYRAARRANVNIDCLSLGLSVTPRPDNFSFCKEIASNTNGQPVVDLNYQESEVPALFRSEQSYYLIGFESATAARDGRFRNVDVKVDRPGVDVRAPRGYYAVGPSPSATSNTRATAEALFAASLPSNDLPLQMAVAPFAGVGGATPSLAVALSVTEPGVAWSASDTLLVEVRSFAATGGAEWAQRETVRWGSHPANTGDRKGQVLVRIDLPPGYHELRAVVRSVKLGKGGSVVIGVDVPAFTKNPLSLSGVVVHAEPDVAALGTAPLAGLLSVVPTARRDFAASDHVTTWLSLYHGSSGTLSPVTLTTSILNDHDEVAYSASELLTADRFAGGWRATSSFALPLDRLKPGAYLLTFEATMGTEQAERDVQFSIK